MPLALIEQFDWFTLALLLFIIVARIVDVAIGTVRTICVVRGYRLLAAVLGFFEVTIWIVAVGGVLEQITALKVIAYGLGFALGNAAGIWLEGRIALGHQMILFVSRQRLHSIAFALRMANFRVTELPARGREGRVAMSFVVVPRRRAPEALRIAQAADENVFYTINDVKGSIIRKVVTPTEPTGWRAIVKRK